MSALSKEQDLTDITAGLDQNPLPDAWVVRPAAHSREALAQLSDELEKLPGVAETHLDSQWAERLQAALTIGRTGVWLLAGLFAIALVAISGNAIRAQVLTRRDEIHVSRLIGATDRYIRRPFIYLGALQGLLGGLAAGAVLAVAGMVLQAPVAHLASLYGSGFSLAGAYPHRNRHRAGLHHPVWLARCLDFSDTCPAPGRSGTLISSFREPSAPLAL